MELLEPHSASPAEEMGWIFAWVVTAPSSVPSWVQRDCKVHIKDLIEQTLLTRVSVTLVEIQFSRIAFFLIPRWAVVFC